MLDGALVRKTLNPTAHLRMPVAEGAALNVLPAEPHVVACTFQQIGVLKAF